jgi:hypothetical protein
MHISSSAGKFKTSCIELKGKLGVNFFDLPHAKNIEEIFLEAVETHNFSQESCNALLCGLYYYGFLSVLEVSIKEGRTTSSPDFSRPQPILLAADEWIESASDANLLASVVMPILGEIQNLIAAITKLTTQKD